MKSVYVVCLFLLTLNVFAEAEKKEPSADSKPVEKPCDFVNDIASAIKTKNWKELSYYIDFPIERSFPFKSATKKVFMNQPELFFSKDMFGENFFFEQKNNYCLVNKGLIWISQPRKKILKINFETTLAKQKRLEKTSRILDLLDQNWKGSKVMLSCVYGGNDYHVYKLANKYLLIIAKGKKIIEKISQGNFRTDDSQIRYFKFNQGKASLTLADNIVSGGYYLQYKPKDKKELFFKCLESNT